MSSVAADVLGDGGRRLAGERLDVSDEREAAAKLDGRVVEQSRLTPEYPRSAEGSVPQHSEVERTREEEVVTAVENIDISGFAREDEKSLEKHKEWL
ncbi:hypothetical protein MRX96_033100 [Rhipicephalus microplus]